MTKREILKIISFLLLFLFLVRTVTYITRTNGAVKDRFVGFYAEENNTIDVIYIGSSPVYPCFATPMLYGEYGIASYALSSHMQRPKAAVYLVREALKTQKPALFVFEMRMYTSEEEAMMGNMAHTRGVTDNLKYSLNRIRAINALVPDRAERYTYWFDIFKYHSNWKTMVLPSQLRTFRYEYPDPLKGFVADDGVGPSEAADFSSVTEAAPVEDIQETALRDLLRELEAHGQDALFVVVPTLLRENDMEKYNYLEGIVTEAGYGFLNMNRFYDDIGIDFATDFKDYGNHVNAAGADKVSRYFADYLKSHYAIPDRRTAPGSTYADWDRAYERWKETDALAKETIARRIREEDWTVIGEEE